MFFNIKKHQDEHFDYSVIFRKCPRRYVDLILQFNEKILLFARKSRFYKVKGVKIFYKCCKNQNNVIYL